MALPYPNLDYVINGEEASGTINPGTWGYVAVNRSPYQLLKNDEYLLQRISGCAELAGASFVGRVFLAADPVEPLEAATKQYTDRKAEPCLFVFQNVSAVWTIVHNLGRKVSVTIFDQLGNTCYGSVKHIDLNSVRIEFLTPVRGSAYLI